MELFLNRTKYAEMVILKHDVHFAQKLINGKHWDEKLLDAYLPLISKDGVCLDVGSHVGFHSVALAATGHDVWSFDANPVMFKLLNINAAINNVNIHSNNIAVGQRSDIEVSISNRCADTHKPVKYDSPLNFGGLSLGSGSNLVSMRRIDDIVSENELKVVFMKVDVEGAEPLVFHGAQDTITRDMPIIFFESNYKKVTPEIRSVCQSIDSEERFDVIQFCQQLGYQPPVRISDNLFLIPEPSNIPELHARYDSGWSYENRIFTHPFFGQNQVIFSKNNMILVYFTNTKCVFSGKVEGDKIFWSNNTIWTSR